MIENILVAVDGSPASNRAITLAAEMASKHEATLRLLNVVREIQIPPDMKNMARVENLGETRMGVLEYVANQILEAAEKVALEAGATRVERSLGRGDPATVIADYANRHRVDLIVMGTRGLGSVSGMLMGSVSRKALNICSANCLVVR
jgi:nucleotide-binding universal stress UspA family protein